MDFDLQRFNELGFAVTEPLLSSTQVRVLISLIEADVQQESKRGGVRDVMSRVPSLAGVAELPSVRAIVKSILGEGAFVVRSTLFDKTQVQTGRFRGIRMSPSPFAGTSKQRVTAHGRRRNP